MKPEYLFVSGVSENGFFGYTEDYPTICYNVIRAKDEEYFNMLMDIIDKDKTLTEPFAAGRFIGVISYSDEIKKWHIDFMDLENDDIKAIEKAITYEFDVSRKFMAVFNKLSPNYEREYAKFKMVVGSVPDTL